MQNDPVRLADWESRIPNYECKCREGYEKFKEIDPPDFASPMAFFHWTVRIHNAVNKKLGKPELTLGQALTLWR
ncbi:MAG: ERV1/ALR-related protein, partial [bacterium]